MPDFKLTPNFAFYEMTQTSNAALQELNRQKGLEIKDKLTLVAKKLELLRAKTGMSIQVHSSFRCPELNSATKGSSSKSQHMLGEAVDFSGPGQENEAQMEEIFNKVLDTLSRERIPFGQLIKESAKRDYGRALWLHMSLGAPFREPAKCGQVMTMNDGVFALLKQVPVSQELVA